MKKIIVFGACVAVAQPAVAQMTESYYYRVGEAPEVVLAASSQQANPAPAPQTYGFYRQQPAAQAPYAQGGTQTYYAAPNRGGYGQAGYNQNSYNQANYYRSPVYNQQAVAKKLYYVGVHGGVATSMGWPKGMDDLVVPMFGLTLGTYLTNNVRVDGEFAYHAEGKLAKTHRTEVKYKQYNLGANVYYDFDASPVFKPFVGAGIWGVQGKTSAKIDDKSKAMSGVKTGLSVSAGVKRVINENFSFIAMARGRYIFSKEGIYNLEALLGIQYHF